MIKKNLKIIFPIVLIVSLLVAIPQASALFEDKVYDPITETITIRNWINQPIISLQLLENTDQCLVNCSALINITPHRDIDANNEAKYRFDFYDKKDRNALAIGKLKEWKLKKQIIEDYEININDYGICISGNGTEYSCVIGSHKEIRQRIKWKPFILNPSFWKKGESVIIKLEGKKQLGSSVEWLPTIYGFELTEWAWWNSDWEKKKSINVIVSSGSTKQDYVVVLNVTYDSDMQADFDDLRFSDGSENIELDYYLRDKVDSEWAEVYVEIDQNIITSNYTFYMYYRNSGASSASNCSATFLYCADFEDGTLGTVGSEGSVTVTTHNSWKDTYNICINDTDSGYHGIMDNFNNQTSFSGNYIIEWDLNVSTYGNQPSQMRMGAKQYGFDPMSYSLFVLGTGFDGNDGSVKYYTTAWNELPVETDISMDAWHHFEAKYNVTDNSANITIDYNEKGKATNYGAGTSIGYNLLVGAGTQIARINLDNIIVHYYSFPEPIYYFGNEESIEGVTSTLISPADNTNTTTTQQNFICNATTVTTILENITLYIWSSNDSSYYQNTINISGTQNQSNWIINLYDDTYTWNCLVYDVSGNYSDWAINFTLIIDTRTSVNEVYDSEVMETQNTNFTLSIETASISEYNEINATFYYNNTIYNYDYKTIIENITNFTKIIIVPNIDNNIENASFYWNYSIGNADYNTTIKNQTIYKFIISICNVNYTTSGLNFTIKDELNQSLINGDLSINFVYWQYGQADLNKTYEYSGTNNSNYTFCIYPENATIYSDYIAYYSVDGYPERRYYAEDAMLTKEVTQINLYLLETDEGMYARFKTVTQYQEAIANVNVIMEKLISGTYVTIEREETDDSGLATFWVDPDSDYRFTFTKTGYIQEILTLRPTSTEIYTIIMGTEVEEEEKSMYTGLSYEFSLSPTTSILNNNTIYNFSFSYTSSYWIITNCTFYLKNKNDSSILAQNNSGWSSGSGYILITYNTSNLTGIIAEAVLEENSTYTLTLQTEYTIRFTYEGEFSLKNFFDDLAAFSQAGFNDFSRMIIAFIMIFVLTALICYFTGLANPEGIILFVWAMIGIFSYLGWFYMSYSGIPSGFGELNKYIIFYIITLTSLGFIIWRHT